MSNLKEVIGIVTDCQVLNIRTTPSGDAGIPCTVHALSELMINLAESTEEFYKVCTAAGVEGFCTKKYVAIKQ